MKTLISQIINAETGLNKIANTSLPISQSIKIAKNIKELEVVYTEYNKQRRALIEKYGKEIINPVTGETNLNPVTGETNLQVTNENMEVFLKELKAILDTEVELNIEPFNLNDSDVRLSPAEYLSLEFLLTNELAVA
jgi:hypothetical protein